MFSDKIYKNFSSGCGSRTTLSVGYEPPMIFEHLCFKSSYPFHSPANFYSFKEPVAGRRIELLFPE